MEKNSKKEAYYARLRKLANINETVESKKNVGGLGTLVDYKRGADNVAYGIVKENHQYFIKKSNKQKEPLVEDFAYIGGLENIHEYRYNKLSEADKNRNMLLATINEALGHKNNVISENNSKKSVISEEKTRKEKNIPGKKQDMDNDGDIDSADYMVKKDAAVEKAMEKEDKKSEKKKSKKEDNENELDEGAEEEIEQAEEKLGDAEEKAEEIPNDEPEVDLDVDAIDLPPKSDNEVSADDVGDEKIPPVDDDASTVGMGGEDVPSADNEDDEEVSVDDEESEEKSPAIDADDEENNREIEKLVGKAANMVRKTDMTDSKVKYYLNSFISAFEEKLPELEIEERKDIANRIIKVVPDSESELEDTDVEGEKFDESKICNECGFAKYVNERGYGPDELMECSVDEMSNLMNGYAMEMDGDVPEEDLANMAMLSTSEISESLENDYGQTDLIENMQPFAEKVNENNTDSEAKTKKIEGMFWWKTKPQEKKDTELKTLSEENVGEGMNGNDPTHTTVQPNINEDDIEDELETGVEAAEDEIGDNEENNGEEEVNLTPGFETMGGGVPKPESAEPTTVEITKDSVNVKMNESEKKLRKYIRRRLEENAGKRKPVLNENKKSDKIKKLDKLIDEQFKLFENVMKEDKNLSEIFGLSDAEKNQKRFKKIDQNNPESIESTFNQVFSQALKMGARKKVAQNFSTEEKYQLMKKGIDVDGLEDPGFAVRGGKVEYVPIKRDSDFGHGRSRLGT